VYDGGNGQVAGSRARTFDVGNITEGCVADDLLGHLYMAQETAGIWKYGAEPDAGDARTMVDSTDGGNLVADVEGLSLYYAGSDLGYLFASSQGESRVAVYEREGDNAFLGKFDVAANGPIDEVTGSDGLDITNFPLDGPFDAGLFAIHDTDNEGADASNVKLVSYGAIASTLELVIDTVWDPRLVGDGEPPPPPFDFLVSVDPAAGAVEPGESLTTTVTATLVSGTSHDVEFSCDNLPEATSCTFTPPSCSPTCDATLSLATDPSTPDGTYSINVAASDGAISRSAVFLLTVAEPPPFEFDVSVDPASGSVEPGGSLDVGVSATLVSGSTHEVRFACEGLPTGAACEFTPPECSPTCTADLSLTTSPSTPDGTYAIHVEASDGTITRTAEFLLTIASPPPFDFALTLDPSSGAVEPGGSIDVSVDATLISGDSHEVAFSCEDLPAGTACDFTPPSCSPTCGADLLLLTDPDTPAGTYMVLVTASDGTITRFAPFVLTVQAPPPPPVPTSLFLEPEIPDPSRPGDNVTVSAVLVRNDTREPLQGKPVHFEGSDDGGRTWWPAGVHDTDAEGRATGSLRFLREGQDQRIRARFEGDVGFDASVSNEQPHRTQSDSLPAPPPTARFTFQPTSPRVGDLIAFNASTSTGTALQARWDWDGAGPGAYTPWSSTLTRTHAFGAAGDYSVLLEVQDSNLLTDTEQRTVVVALPPVLPDTTPPTVAIVSPAAGSVLSSRDVRVTGTASDDRALAVVDLSLDGLVWTEAFGTSSWAGLLTLGEGTHTIIARARDAANNTHETRVTVDVQLSGSSDGRQGPVHLTAAASAWLGLLPVVLGTAAALTALALAAAYFAESEKRHRPAPRASRTRVHRLRLRRARPPRPR
jgi:hypothetical protein